MHLNHILTAAFGTRLAVILLVVMAHRVIALAADSPCLVTDSLGKVLFDLRQLEHKDGGYKVDGFGSGYNFTINMCQGLSAGDKEQQRPVAARWWKQGDETGSMGRISNKPQLRGGHKLLVEYTDGDVCPNNGKLRQSTLISFICTDQATTHGNNGYGEPEFVTEWDHCAFIFEWKTPLACPRSNVNNNPEGKGDDEDNGDAEPSRGSIIFIAVFVFGSLYILGGFLYNRVSSPGRGLRGIEQLPNYRFWLSICQFIKRSVLVVVDGLSSLTRAVTGRRRGAIRIDEAEYNIRHEIFDSADEDEGDALPFVRR